MERTPMEVTRQDRIYCLKVSSDYHSEVCEECKFYPNCDHMTQDDMTELTIKDLEALEQQKLSEDCVSRQAVLEEIPVLWNGKGDKDYCMETLRDFVTELQPVTPTHKVGKWVTKPHVYGVTFCSECGFELKINNTNYCPMCGAEMESE